jgi:putative flippase GtrA
MENLPAKPDLHRLCKYGLVGGLGAVIDFSLFAALIGLTHLPYLVANLISFSIGTIVVYYLQKNWTFEHGDTAHSVVFGKFLLVVVITFLLNNAILIICISILLLNPLLSKIIQILLSFVFGFTSNSKFVFRSRET